MPASHAPTPVLLYDGDCGFCAGSVQFVLLHEPASRRDALRFAPLQGAFGSEVRAQHPEIASIESVVWFDASATGNARVQLRSSAALSALAHLGGVWRLVASLARIVPRALRDVVYDMIARRRFEIAAPACLLPTAHTRARFLA